MSTVENLLARLDQASFSNSDPQTRRLFSSTANELRAASHTVDNRRASPPTKMIDEAERLLFQYGHTQSEKGRYDFRFARDDYPVEAIRDHAQDMGMKRARGLPLWYWPHRHDWADMAVWCATQVRHLMSPTEIAALDWAVTAPRGGITRFDDHCLTLGSDQDGRLNKRPRPRGPLAEHIEAVLDSCVASHVRSTLLNALMTLRQCPNFLVCAVGDPTSGDEGHVIYYMVEACETWSKASAMPATPQPQRTRRKTRNSPNCWRAPITTEPASGDIIRGQNERSHRR